MIRAIKRRCGIAEAVQVYDEDIQLYIDDCLADMLVSGVPKSILDSENESVLTAVTLYVKAYLGTDGSDAEKYLDLYRKKVFRLTLEGEDGDVDQEHCVADRGV